MQAVYYGQGIAVYGDTKPWKENLKALGGGFRSNLGGRPGWIFTKQNEAALMQFIANAQAGLVQPIAPTPAPVATPVTHQMVPFGQVQPAMTPQAALTRLTIAQPTVAVGPAVPGPTPGVVQPAVPAGIAPIAPVVPAPIQPGAQVAPHLLTLGFPTMAKAADGLVYQIVMYTVPVPSVGQHIIIHIGDAELRYTVSQVLTVQASAPITEMLIQQDPVADAALDAQPAVSRAIISEGKWQIQGMQDAHTLTFLPLDQ